MSEKQSSPSAKGLLRGGGRSVPEVLKPLVFPNHQGLFRIFTTVVTAGRWTALGCVLWVTTLLGEPLSSSIYTFSIGQVLSVVLTDAFGIRNGTPWPL